MRHPATPSAGRRRTLAKILGSGAALAVGLTAVVLVAVPHATRTAGAVPVSLPLLAAPQTTTSTTSPPPPAGDPTTTMVSPTDGSSVSAGAAITLTAALSSDLVTALGAGSGGSCSFAVGDDANSVLQGTLDLTARTCTGSWTPTAAGSYQLNAWVNTPSGITYVSASITVTVSGGANPRCTGSSGAPATCSYHWAEVYYTSPSNTRYARVCDIDGGCQWQTAHTSWAQISGKAYWINSTGTKLPDGNLAEAYLCVGSSPAAWSSYTSTHSFDALLGRADTSASPVPDGVC